MYDDIKRSSQLRTLLKRVVVNCTWKNSGPYGIWTQVQFTTTRFSSVLETSSCKLDLSSNPVRAGIFFRSNLQLLVSVVFLKRVVVNWTWVQIPYGPEFFQVQSTTTRFSSVLSCEDLLISSLHRSANIWIFIYLKSSFKWMYIHE